VIDEKRLIRCFTAVFPDIPSERLPEASVDEVAEWDSLAAVTLLVVLEEEFEIEISPLDVPDLRSYAEIRDYLDHRL
jgi:acyl carrier protein